MNSSCILFHDLKPGREYYVVRYNGKKHNGIFDRYRYSYMSGDKEEYAWFHNSPYYYIRDDDFYDVEKIIESAQLARQNMEQRSLNMILKRLVNEEFEWS